MIRVMIIDDHSIVRKGVRSLLAETSDVEVVGEAADGASGLALARTEQPDVIVLDLSLPGTSGLEVLRQLRREVPRSAVLVLSMHPEERYAVLLLRAGASGYVAKQAPSDVLVGAIRKVAAGGKFIGPEVAERLAIQIDPDFRGPPHDKLSARELEVLLLLAAGKQATAIAVELGISVKTVSTYRRRVLDKLELDSTAELVRYAYQNALVD